MTSRRDMAVPSAMGAEIEYNNKYENTILRMRMIFSEYHVVLHLRGRRSQIITISETIFLGCAYFITHLYNVETDCVTKSKLTTNQVGGSVSSVSTLQASKCPIPRSDLKNGSYY